MKKPFLFLIIAVPVLIYMFLKFFGNNTFQTPKYYSGGIYSEFCGINTDQPYRISFQDTLSTNNAFNDKILLFFVGSGLNKNLAKMTKELERSILSQSLAGITVIGLQDTGFQVSPIDGVRYISLSTEDLRVFINCNLMVSQEVSDTPFHYIVMVDGDRRIRGYYDGSKFDEYDRLAAELDILSFEN
jgi:hypothetical protein